MRHKEDIDCHHLVLLLWLLLLLLLMELHRK
jgi:hypothetical protein